jgi:hypothetical protein
MIFLHPTWLYALLLVPLAGLFLWWARRRRAVDLSRLGNPALIQKLSDTVNWQGRRWKDALWLVVLTLSSLPWPGPSGAL